MCFAWLGKDLISLGCKGHRVCNICNDTHPTSIHSNKKREQANNVDKVKLNAPISCGLDTYLLETNISMCVVSILHHDSSKSDILTYSLLDNCSQGSFISYELYSMLDISICTTEVTVKAITSIETKQCCFWTQSKRRI